MSTVLCIGHAALDHVFRVKAFPATATKVRAEQYEINAGGMAANAAAAIVALSGRARYVGPLGDDDAGRFVLARLAEAGVDTRFARQVAGESTSVSSVTVDADGERLIVGMRGSALRAAPVAEDLEALVDTSVLLADVRWVRGALPLMRAARQQGILTVVDADVGNAEEISQLLSYADIAAFSGPGLAEWAGTRDDADALRMARNAGAHIALVTHGERGVVWRDENGLHALSGFQVDAVDTTGAGDTWHGALALELARGAPFETAVLFANAAAALKVTRQGAWNVPNRTLVVDFLTRCG
jgi:sulfofructose kinase